MILVSDHDRITLFAVFSDPSRVWTLLKFFGPDRIFKFQYPQNTDLHGDN